MGFFTRNVSPEKTEIIKEVSEKSGISFEATRPQNNLFCDNESIFSAPESRLKNPNEEVPHDSFIDRLCRLK